VVKYDKTLIAKGSSQNLMRSSMTRIVSHYMTLFLVQNHERVRYHNDFKVKRIIIDEVTLPVIASTICKNASTLHMQQLNDSLAKELKSTQVASKRVSWKLYTKTKNVDLQSIVKDKCKYLSANPQRSYCRFS
jgi:hypothetical protein